MALTPIPIIPSGSLASASSIIAALNAAANRGSDLAQAAQAIAPVATYNEMTAALGAGLIALVPKGVTLNMTAPLNIPAGSRIQIDGVVRRDPSMLGSMMVLRGNGIRFTGRGSVNGNRANLVAAPGGPIGCIVTFNNEFYSDILVEGLTFLNEPNWPISITANKSIIRGVTAYNCGNSLQFVGGDGNVVTDTHVRDITDMGIALYGECSNSIVSNCTATGCDIGVGVLSDAGRPGASNNCDIVNNRTYGNRAYGVGIIDRQGVSRSGGHRVLGNVSIIDGIAGGVDAIGINLSGVTRCVVTDNVVSDIAGSSAIGIGVDAPTCSAITVARNTVERVAAPYSPASLVPARPTDLAGVIAALTAAGVCQ